MEKRKAIRAVLLSEATNEILLIKCEVPDSGEVHWITPGGGIDDNESDLECLKREVREETGYSGNCVGKLIWIRNCIFTFAGVTCHQSESYYLVKVKKFEPINSNLADNVEMSAFRGFQWWSPKEILNSNCKFIPNHLGQHLAKLLFDNSTKEIIDVS